MKIFLIVFLFSLNSLAASMNSDKANKITILHYLINAQTLKCQSELPRVNSVASDFLVTNRPIFSRAINVFRQTYGKNSDKYITAIGNRVSNIQYDCDDYLSKLSDINSYDYNAYPDRLAHELERTFDLDSDTIFR